MPAAIKMNSMVKAVDLATGKESESVVSWGVLPPAPDRCQTCAVDHTPDQPHDAGSLFYQFTFGNEHGRAPTWTDAMAHCTAAVRDEWTDNLRAMGVDIPKMEGNDDAS
jgi:hypothetical protein